MALFQSAVLRKHLGQLDPAAVAAAYAVFTAHFHDGDIQANIRASKEEQYQEGFLRDLFVHVLGYTLNPQKGYELTTEYKNEKGAKKADGAILVEGKALAVIELKGTDTTDLGTINAQAFNYKANHSNCVYVVTSNFRKLRFFIDNAVDHLEFDLFTLSAEDFALLWLCLQRDNLLDGLPKKVKAQSLQVEEQVTKRLYKDYSTFKNTLWQDLCANHPELDKLLLYKKTQKLLDRFLFVLFSEDKGLLPPNSIRQITDQWGKLKELDAYVPLYDRFRKYFGYLNTGHKGQHHDIFAYNGGLFKPDEVLDSVRITDELLHSHVVELSKYDFSTEVDVHILGHIFEHSLNEIENVTAMLEGREVDAKKSKRKKDGVFYTPKYITKYIVENTVGRLCTEKKDELAIVDEEYAKGRRGRQKKTIQELDTKLDVYRDWLLSLTICDPACGSGAFLNQALDFLIGEHRYVDDLQATLLGHSITFKDIGDHILERNIYGVDINEESVEIARLSLWLRTATKGRKLNDLSSNIKCGNSLIDDPAVAGDKAFDWKKEFPRVFERGGFDVVVGNPPYVSSKGEYFDEITKDFLNRTFDSAVHQIDLYAIFLEQGLLIQNSTGITSFITPNTWLNNVHLSQVRKYILNRAFLHEIVSMPSGVFEGANVDTVICTYSKNKRSELVRLYSCIDTEFNLKGEQTQINWLKSTDFVINVHLDAASSTIIEKMDSHSVRLGAIAEAVRGVGVYHKRMGHSKDFIASDPFQSATKLNETFVPYLRGKNLQRWLVDWNSDSFISYGDWLAEPREARFFNGERVLIRKILSNRIVSSMISTQFVVDQQIYTVAPYEPSKHHPKALLGIVNSTLMTYYFKHKFSEFDELFPQIKLSHIKELPIVDDVRIHRNITGRVDAVLQFTSELQAVKASVTTLLQSKFSLPKLSRKLEQWPSLEFKVFLKELKRLKVQLRLAEEAEWLAYFNEQKAKANALQQQIDATDKQIDALVYELYGLTEEEVKVVESGTGNKH